jgi:hypothetical protein
MERRTEMLIAGGVLVALAILLLALFFRKDEEASTEIETPVVRDDESVVPHVDPEDIPAQHEVSAATVGRIFVERFGSFSSESDYENIDDVMTLATTSLQSRLEDLAETARGERNDEYYGVSTRIITVKTEVATETSARFLITTQREEAIADPGNTSVRYQDIRVELLKEGDSWLVDAFTWL